MSLVLVAGILEEISQHAKAEYPREGCGLITRSRFIPMTNVAQSAAEFEMDPAELVNTLTSLGYSLQTDARKPISDVGIYIAKVAAGYAVNLFAVPPN